MPEIDGGRIIGQKYELVRMLGRGSMGEVWVARHQALCEDVAIKIMAPFGAGHSVEFLSELAARFRFEAHIAARLSRKTRHIARVTDYGEDESGVAYLVMELLEGETLERHLMRRGPMALDCVSQLVSQIARALEQAHAEGVIHRDLKPANVFIMKDEDGGTLIKLLDFGIARAIRTQRVTTGFATGHGILCGTPGYMSPEQAGASKVDSQCDLWALATIAYEAMTCELPVSGASVDEIFANLRAGRIVPVHEHRPELPRGLAKFFELAFAPHVGSRHGSARELSTAFEQAIADGDTRGGREPVFFGPSVHRAVAAPAVLFAAIGIALLAAASSWPRHPWSRSASIAQTGRKLPESSPLQVPAGIAGSVVERSMPVPVVALSFESPPDPADGVAPTPAVKAPPRPTAAGPGPSAKPAPAVPLPRKGPDRSSIL